MPRLPRPHIPIAVRCAVAARQLANQRNTQGVLRVMRDSPTPKSQWLAAMLALLFPDGQKYHLDHDPALALRRKIIRKGIIIGYNPPANDPRYLIYRERHDHHIKTNVRGEHGQFCDTVLMKRERRRQKKTAASKPVKRAAAQFAKIAKKSRPIPARRSAWPPKGSRPFRRRR